MRLVVIGGVAAGLSAAARARRLDRNAEIVVFEKGDTISYGACGLPYLIEGRVKRAEDLIVYTAEKFASERRVEIRTNTRVAAISHARREVALDNNERVPYDNLVIATGARAETSWLPGAEQPHVFTLQTLGDGRRLRAFLDQRKPRRAVVIGAGYIGLEAADALRRNGLAVTIFERDADLLRREDPELTKAIAGLCARHRVELRCGVRVSGIAPDRVEDVPCDLVLVGAGVKPNVEIAAEAGVEIGRTGAIRVGERTETNLHGVYAAGDCAEIAHLITGKPAYLPLGTTANKMGRVAGANAAGYRERFPGVVGTSIFSLFSTGVALTGLSEAQARRAGFSPVCARIQHRARPRYYDGRMISVELVADRNSRRLLGGTVIGEQGIEGRINVIATALTNRMTVDDFETLDLAYSPPFAPVWDPVLIAAQQLIKAL